MPDSDHAVLALFAHPDDESFLCAGTFAALSDAGIPVTLVSATRGEAGEINHPDLATPENLGEVRESELRAAMAAVGVSDVRFLDYRDSGMAGTDDNHDPRAFSNAPPEQIIKRLLSLMNEIRPTAVITFGADGIYGHPDHLRIHQLVTDAVFSSDSQANQWRPDALYYASVPRETFIEFGSREGGPFEGTPLEELQKMGTPMAEITTTLDVAAFGKRKWAALTAHLSQFGDQGPLSGIDQRDVVEFLRYERYIHVPLPWSDERSDPIAELALSAPSES
jgi:LmbE family N-acetylglucosaminyl deacetylase